MKTGGGRWTNWKKGDRRAMGGKSLIHQGGLEETVEGPEKEGDIMGEKTERVRLHNCQLS